LVFADWEIGSRFFTDKLALYAKTNHL
jgi:hypothetical protein